MTAIINDISSAYIPGFIISLCFSLLFVPIIRQRAILSGFFDLPGGRKIHRVPVPRLGGVGVFLSFMVALLLLVFLNRDVPHGSGLWGMIAGGTLIFILGLLDDLYNISPYIKLVGQVVAAVVSMTLGVMINYLDLPGSLILFLHGLNIPITLLWLVGISNSINFIDGVDGLAAGVITLSSVTLAVVAIFNHQPQAALLAALLAGSNLGFLVYNFYPARIFMGDSGALFSGFMLASIAITGVLKTQIAVMLVPILVLTVPILDITYSTFRRLLRGQSPFVADADHIHHKLLQAGYSQLKTVVCLYAVCLVAGMLATFYVGSLGLYCGLMFGVFIVAGGLIYTLHRYFPAEPLPEKPLEDGE